jgi:hypothetical protein
MSKYFVENDKQVKFLTKILGVNPESAGLDLGCDTGTHLIKLQNISPFIYGADRINQIKLKNFLHLNFFEDEILLEDLDFVYCLNPYFGRDWWSMEKLMKNLALCLKRGGLFCLDLYDFNTVEVGKDWIIYRDLDDRNIETTFTRLEDRVEAKRVVTYNTLEVNHIDMLWRVFKKTEIVKLAFDYGFRLKTDYADFDPEKPGIWEPTGSIHRLCVVLERL